jgi:hypothetical protein
VTFDHPVVALVIRDGEPFACCATCNFPVGLDVNESALAANGMGYAHLDDPNRRGLFDNRPLNLGIPESVTVGFTIDPDDFYACDICGGRHGDPNEAW